MPKRKNNKNKKVSETIIRTTSRLKRKKSKRKEYGRNKGKWGVHTKRTIKKT